MKYLLDEKNNQETIYAMNPDCEVCLSIAMADTDYEENNLPLDCCAECPLYYDGCFNHNKIYSGEIGSSFLEFISLDFEEIKNNLLKILEKQQFEQDLDKFKHAFDRYTDTLHWFFTYIGVGTQLGAYKSPDYALINTEPLMKKEIESLFSEIIVIQKIVAAYAENKDFINHEYLLRGINQLGFMYFHDSSDQYFLPEVNTNDPIIKLKEFAEYAEKTKNEPLKFLKLEFMFGKPFEWIVKNDYPISVCQNCGKFFVPYKRNDAKYCSHIFKDNKTCRELAFEIKVENDDVLRLYRKIYKTKNAWKNRNKKNSPNAEKAFDEWHKSAKQKVDDFNARKISKEECMTWLENSRRRE